MRMWNVDPDVMCRQHLLGEHAELHMFAGTIAAGKRLDGYLDNGLVEPANIHTRHDELVVEMKRRGMRHQSPLPQPDVSAYGPGAIDPEASLGALVGRCARCSARAGTTTASTMNGA